MELADVMTTTHAVRSFTDEAVDEELLVRILDRARFAPSGGNRQGWHVVVVRDRGLRRVLRELYVETWYEYLTLQRAGLAPWSPLADRDEEAEALRALARNRADPAFRPGHFAEHLDEVPVLLLVFVNLRAIVATDRDLERYGIVGGGSVYPFAWNVLLAARDLGLGGVMTTMLTRSEARVRTLLHVPENFAFAATIALGFPTKQLTRLRRAPVEDFTTIDFFDGDALGPSTT